MSKREICKVSLLSRTDVRSEKNKFWKLKKLKENGNIGESMCSY
jgi:hypothetical protein